MSQSPDFNTRVKPKAKAKRTVKAAPAQDLATFAAQVLSGLGVPNTPLNRSFIQAWANREGGGGAFNPLNTTQPMPGSSALAGNSAGVQNFTSLAQGVQATVHTLQNGNYGDVLQALSTGKANPNETYKGLATWSDNGYDSLTGVSSTNRSVAASGATGTGTGTYTGGTATPTRDSVTNYARTTYGYLAAFLDDPVIGPVLKQAASQNLDNAQLLGLIYKNPTTRAWWNHTSDTARQFDADAKLDQAAHAQKISVQRAQILALAGQDGFALDPARAQKIATDSLRLGWSDQQVKQAVAQEYHYDPANAGNATVAQLKQYAYNYAIPLSDTAIQSWATKIMGGTATPDDFVGYAKQQAKSLYPTIASALDGVDTQTYFDPYKQIASQELGVTPDSINLMDPKWQKAVMGTADDGTRVPMTLDQWRTTLRSDPTYGYGHTTEAQNAAAATGQSLLSAMGM